MSDNCPTPSALFPAPSKTEKTPHDRGAHQERNREEARRLGTRSNKRGSNHRHNHDGARPEPPDNGLARNARFISMPMIRRASMVPSKIDFCPVRRLWRKFSAKRMSSAQRAATANPRGETPSDAGNFQAGWRESAKRRRIILTLLVVLQTTVATWSLAQTFPWPEFSRLEIAIVPTFAILFSWISFSFWINVAGFWTLWRTAKIRGLAPAADECADQPLRSRTAVVMPICNEDAPRCFAGIASIYRSVAATGQLDLFDFYVLSDTGDARCRAHEQVAWAQTCSAVSGFSKIFYRHRRNNIKRKSGNIADFLRRWSQRYDYMIVLDADSLMSGETIVRLARMMDHAPQVGIIQTVPAIVNGASLFARMQQFASRVYGPLFSASLRYWQLGESYYWGHNAILRVAPFVKHCGLARLPGRPPLGGEILSHDFVEAALMGRAGLEVWLAYDLPGSFEESPPSLLDELKRDRRWCQGNLQHWRFLFGDAIRFGHRAIMAMGIMAYASALLWAVFLILSSAEVVVQSLTLPVYFPYRRSLFPLWPTWHPELTVALLTTTGLLLVLPKLLSVALILKNRQSAGFGGLPRLALGIGLEIILSTLIAPARMWFHGKYVLLTLLGRQIKWTAQRRNDSETGWREAMRQHGFSTVLALAWVAAAICWDPLLTWWLLPVCVPLSLSIPLSVYSSRVGVGRVSKRWQLFRIPEESMAPPVVQGLHERLANRVPQQLPSEQFANFSVEDFINQVHVGLPQPAAPKHAEHGIESETFEN